MKQIPSARCARAGWHFWALGRRRRPKVGNQRYGFFAESLCFFACPAGTRALCADASGAAGPAASRAADALVAAVALDVLRDAGGLAGEPCTAVVFDAFGCALGRAGLTGAGLGCRLQGRDRYHRSEVQTGQRPR